ncbi:MAG: DNA repair protein RecN [Paludibacteraceae bacterium]|nr:DNA repair protein RecN [Paludibacteraceae bacterium]
MLKHLHIQNYALISRLDIDFGEGFSVLTGETGAGKSIILGALALVMGARADSKAITDGEDKCIIEAEFDEGIVRRELYANGKSRSFVDDSVVILQELKALANRLIDIHSQHANLLIENVDFQLGIVDAVAGNEKLLNDYSGKYDAYLTAQQKLNELQALARKSRQDADYIQYHYKQLDEANLQSGELDELEQEQYTLSHAEEIRAALETTVAALTNEEGGAIEALRSCRLDEIAQDLQERIDSARIELQDIAEEAGRKLNRIEMNPARLEWVEERMDTLNSLLHKFSAETIDELIKERDELAEQVNRLDSFDFDIAQAEKEVAACREVLTKAAAALSKSRKAVVPQIGKKLVEGMKQLGVPHAKIEIPVTATTDFTPSGCDEVQIQFAANLNQSLRPVSEVASGGEISRLMLCVKALIASTKGLPTIIFDEIDTGVSGDIATQMATIMREMADTRQIIAITHLPQIAAIGQTHYKVYKADTATRTETHISLLNNEERITEIASMLSGKHATEAAIMTAKQLLGYTS